MMHRTQCFLAQCFFAAATNMLAVAPVLAAPAPQSPDDVWPLALSHDPVYAAAAAQEAAGVTAYRVRRASVLPTVSATAGVDRINRTIQSEFFSAGGPGGGSSEFEETFETYDYGVSIRQPLFRWDLLSNLETGRVEVIAAEVRLRRTRQELVGRLADAYTAVLAAEDALATAEARVAAVRRQLEQVRDQVDVGTVAITGLREAEAELDLARADRIDAALAVDDAVDQMARIIGTSSFDLARVASVEPLYPVTETPLTDWLAAAQQRNTNVVGARLREELARLDVRSADSARLPQLDAVASYGRNDSSQSLIGQDATEARIGLDLTVPIFTGGATAAQAESARATYLQRSEELRAARELAESEVRTAWRTVRASKRRIRAREQAVTSTAAALAAVRDGYDVGARTLADVLAAEQVALLAKQQFNRARYDFVVAVIDLKLAAGVVTDDDLTLIDAVFHQEGVADPHGPAANRTRSVQ